MARLLALGGLVAAVALLYAWQHFACIQLRYQLESLKSQRAQAAELNQELKLEVAGLRAPARIDQIARRQLGLTAPVAGQVAPFETPSEAVLAEMRAREFDSRAVSSARLRARDTPVQSQQLRADGSSGYPNGFAQFLDPAVDRRRRAGPVDRGGAGAAGLSATFPLRRFPGPRRTPAAAHR